MSPPVGTARAGVVGTRRDVIPDSVVDNFENADADPAGPYASGEDISTYYRGDTSDWGRTSNSVEGSQELSATTAALTQIWSLPGDGLPRYPGAGNTISFLIRPAITPEFLFGLADASTGVNGYGAAMSSGADFMRIYRLDGSAAAGSNETQIASDAQTLADGTWYWGEVVAPTTSSTTVSFTLYDANISNSPPTRGSQLNTISTSDSNHLDNRGIGVTQRSGSTAPALDYIQDADV